MDSFNSTITINEKPVKIQLWDTAGQERFHSIISNYLRNSFLALVVFSIDDRKSLDNVEKWINDFVKTNNSSKQNKHNIIIVCNKVDLNVENFDDIYTHAKNIAEKNGASLIKTSALDSAGIEEMIESMNKYIIDDIENNLESDDNRSNAFVLKTKKRGCC